MDSDNNTSQDIQKVIEKKLASNFVSDEEHGVNISIQKQGAPRVLELFNENGGDSEREHQIEFFFYSDCISKSHQLAAHLRKLNYDPHVVKSAGKQDQYLINGWTSPMRTDDDTISNWSELMCEIGISYDCKFDGWGMFIE